MEAKRWENHKEQDLLVDQALLSTKQLSSQNKV